MPSGIACDYVISYHPTAVSKSAAVAMRPLPQGTVLGNDIMGDGGMSRIIGSSAADASTIVCFTIADGETGKRTGGVLLPEKSDPGSMTAAVYDGAFNDTGGEGVEAAEGDVLALELNVLRVCALGNNDRIRGRRPVYSLLDRIERRFPGFAVAAEWN